MMSATIQPCFSGRCPGFYIVCKILGSGFLFFFCRKKLYIDFTDSFFWILHKDFTIRLVRNKNAVTGRSPKKQLPMMIQDHKGKTYAAKQQSRTEKGEKIMKKTMAVLLAMGLAMAGLTGCSGNKAAETTAAATTAAQTEKAEETTAEETAGKAEGPISVVSREDGSGTRGAFIELFGIEEKNDAGEKMDMTTEDAEITNSTSVMMTTISGNTEAIGYISLGSLNDTVKAVKIDGAEATVENIKSGAYKIARPFNIATKAEVSEVAADFIKFIMSEQGQKVVEDSGYISQGNEGAYEASSLSGKVVVAGSSSVTPVMEKLKEAYNALNPDVTIEVQQSDSTTGVTSAVEGVCDIGMASRELKDSELEKGITGTVIAMDGIAVIVNNESPVEELTSENVKAIFTGEVTDWADVK